MKNNRLQSLVAGKFSGSNTFQTLLGASAAPSTPKAQEQQQPPKKEEKEKAATQEEEEDSEEEEEEYGDEDDAVDESGEEDDGDDEYEDGDDEDEYEDDDDGDEYDEDEDDEDDEEEEEEEEPKLRYQRLGGSVPEIFKTDAASCMAVHEKLLALGTHEGCVYILDLNGNEIMKFTVHTTTVNELSIDATGEYIASCSMDGKVFVHGLLTGELVEYTFSRPVIGLAIDPEYAGKKNSRQFCTGNKAGVVSLCGKGFFGRQKETMIHSGEGNIHTIRWRGNFIAWATDKNIHVYDITAAQRIGTIPRSQLLARPDLYRCSLCWESDQSLIIAVGNSIKITRIKDLSYKQADGLGAPIYAAGNNSGSGNSGGAPQLSVEITHSLETDYCICGVSPFTESELLVFAYMEDDASDSKQRQRRQPPELKIVTRDGTEVSSDGLTIRNYDKYLGVAYRMDFLLSEKMYYLVSPADIIVVRPRDLDDHVAWLLEHHDFEAALRTAEEAPGGTLQSHSAQDIGEKYLEYLLTDPAGKDPAKAAGLCSRLLGRDKARWEAWVLRFHEQGELRALTEYVPVGNPVLSETTYGLILNQHLNDDSAMFLKTIRSWPHTIYNTADVIEAVRDKLRRRPEDKDLLLALAQLHMYTGDFARAVDIYLKLRDRTVFDVIAKHALYKTLTDNLVEFMDFDANETLALLEANTAAVPPDAVVARLAGKRRLLFEYLSALFEKDPELAAGHHQELIALDIEYAPDKLMPLLRLSNSYSLDETLRLCEQHGLYREAVYILERLGNMREALAIILDKIGDIRLAISLVQGQNDRELLQDLVDRAMENPAYISELLENIGGDIDPKALIERIPDGKDIPNLRDRLVKILSDHNLQMSLQEGCSKILKTDCVELFDTLLVGKARGAAITDMARCASCLCPITKARPEDVAVFWCSHVYHLRCLRSLGATGAGDARPAVGAQGMADSEKLWCVICKKKQQQQQRRGVAGQRRVRPVGGGTASSRPSFK